MTQAQGTTIIVEDEEDAAGNFAEMKRHMQSTPILAKIPDILVSAKSLPDDIKTILEAGTSIYLAQTVGYLDHKEAGVKVLGA